MLDLEWRPLRDSRLQSRLGSILKSWQGTRYAIGQGHRGVGGDCVRATALIVCEWLRHPVPPLATLPADASLHNRKATMRAFHAMRRVLPRHRRVRDGSAQPGDLLITGPVSGGPGHAVLVGADRNTTYQMTEEIGFVRGGWSAPARQRLFAVLRFEGTE